MIRPLIVILVALMALAGIAVGVGRALRNPLLTYEANFPTDIELYAYDIERHLSVNLTHNPTSYDTDAAWSPDGEMLAFISWRGGAPHLYLLSLASRNLVKVSEHRASSPAWSPDNTQVVYTAQKLVGAPTFLYVVDVTAPLVDGENPRPLTDGNRDDQYAVWSSFRAEIIFQSDAETEFESEIMTLDPGDLEMTNLTNAPSWDVRPSLSPDGARIAFYSTRDSLNYDIFVMDADGANVRRITDLGIRGTHLFRGFILWSPDGTQIAANAIANGGSEVSLWGFDSASTRFSAFAGTVFDLNLWLPEGLLLTEHYNLSTFRIIQLTPDGEQRVLLENASYPAWWR